MYKKWNTLYLEIDPIQKANFFGLLFSGAPNYGKIFSENKNSAEPPKLNELFKLKMILREMWYPGQDSNL